MHKHFHMLKLFTCFSVFAFLGPTVDDLLFEIFSTFRWNPKCIRPLPLIFHSLLSPLYSIYSNSRNVRWLTVWEPGAWHTQSLPFITKQALEQTLKNFMSKLGIFIQKIWQKPGDIPRHIQQDHGKCVWKPLEKNSEIVFILSDEDRKTD